MPLPLHFHTFSMPSRELSEQVAARRKQPRWQELEGGAGLVQTVRRRSSPRGRPPTDFTESVPNSYLRPNRVKMATAKAAATTCSAIRLRIPAPVVP